MAPWGHISWQQKQAMQRSQSIVTRSPSSVPSGASVFAPAAQGDEPLKCCRTPGPAP
jgi:hypothetical protein